MKEIRQSTGRELNLKFLPFAVGLFGLLYMLTGFRGWLVFLIGTLSLWLLAVAWISSLEHGLSIQRKIHLSWATVGDSVPEELSVVNKSRLPALWVEIVDETEALDSPVRLVSDVESDASRRRHSAHLFKRRGLYTLGPTRLRTSDPFGIYTLTLRDQHSSSILIMPPQLPLSQLKIVPGGWAGDRQRRRNALEREISDAGVRNYLPGDSLRRIHWRASAHGETLIVRQLEAAASDDWWLFVDLDAAAQAGSGEDSTLELSIVLAASLAMRGWREGRRVGLALISSKLVWLEPRADPAHHWRMMQALAMANEGHRSLAELMSLTGSTRTATSIVITPATDPAWLAASGRHHRGGSLITLLVDPTEFGSTSDQSRLIQALARGGIPFTRMPRSLLEQAYSSGNRKAQIGTETGKRYLQNERAAWQRMS